MPLTPLQKIALDAAVNLQKAPGVDGVFVMVMSKGTVEFGTALCAPDVELDIMFATGVCALVEVRKQVLAANAAAAPAKPAPETPAS
jgi:hypothetical protein